MSRGTKARKGKPRRFVSRFPAEVRAHKIALMVAELQAKYLDEYPQVAHLATVVVHGFDARTRQVLEIARPHLDPDTVKTIVQEALGDYANWGTSPCECYAVVDAFASGVMGAVVRVAGLDSAFGETAILCCHPAGAAVLSFTTAHGKSPDFMRRLVFDACGVPFTSRGAA